MTGSFCDQGESRRPLRSARSAILVLAASSAGATEVALPVGAPGRYRIVTASECALLRAFAAEETAMDVGQDRYKQTWEAYWSTLPPSPGEAFWDSAPELAAGLDLPHLVEAFNSTLPVVDFGCGNGTQTRYLGAHFAEVIGVDVSSAAIEVARDLTTERNVRYQTLDGTDPAAVRAFRESIGDVNVYMRTVLHQMLPEHRPMLAQSIRVMMGAGGVTYLLELSDQAHPFFEALLKSNAGPPPQLARVLQCGITPGLLSVDDVHGLFPPTEYSVRTGDSVVNTVHVAPTGERTRVPAFYSIITPRPARH